MARILTATGWKDVLSESRDMLTKREVNQHLKQQGYTPHPDPGIYSHIHPKWGPVKVSNMVGGLHIFGRKIDSFSDPEAVRRDLKKSLKEEFSFDEMTDEEILDLLEQFSDEELEELEEALSAARRAGVMLAAQQVANERPKARGFLAAEVARRQEKLAAKKAAAEQKKKADEQRRALALRFVRGSKHGAN